MTASETVMGYYTLTQCMAGAGTVTMAWGIDHHRRRYWRIAACAG